MELDLAPKPTFCNIKLCLLKVHRCAGRKAGRTVCARTNELAACFFLLQDSVMVLSATHRYKKKYVTTLLYKPI